MRDKYTLEEYQRIETLAEQAISAPNKAQAQRYSNQLLYIGRDVSNYSRQVFSELYSAVVSASGAVRDKEHYVADARYLLTKFKMHCVE